MDISQEFIENTILLLLTAGLTGFLVPLLFRRIDQRKHAQQKIFEADLARQAKIIEAQVKLIEDLAQLLWEFQLRLIAVPYYRQFEGRDLYTPALKAYEEVSGNLLGQIRAEISKALRLTPRSMYQRLKKFYHEHLLGLDLTVSDLAQKEAAGDDMSEKWLELQKFAVYELSDIVDKLIDDLANELDLKEIESEAGDIQE